MNNSTTLWTYVLNMTIAALIHPAPKADEQVRRMAKRYLKEIPKQNSIGRRTMSTVIKASNPSKVVRMAYAELARTEA